MAFEPSSLVTTDAEFQKLVVEYARRRIAFTERMLEKSSVRGLIESIVLMPEKGQLRIELRGNLAAMLTAAQQTKRSPETGDLLVPVQLVAGGGFEPPTFGL